MSKHTPGPWKIGFPDGSGADKDGYYIVSETGVIVVRSRRDNWNVLQGIDNKANARLIAAAPELLASLKTLATDMKEYLTELGGCDHSVGICCCGLVHNLEDAQKAIAKATGET